MTGRGGLCVARLLPGRAMVRIPLFRGVPSLLLSLNCHSFAAVSRLLVALAGTWGAQLVFRRMLVRIRDSLE